MAGVPWVVPRASRKPGSQGTERCLGRGGGGRGTTLAPMPMGNTLECISNIWEKPRRGAFVGPSTKLSVSLCSFFEVGPPPHLRGGTRDTFNPLDDPHLLPYRLRPGASGHADQDRGRQRRRPRGVALAGEPVAAAPGAPLRGRAGGGEVAAVCCALLRRVSLARLALPCGGSPGHHGPQTHSRASGPLPGMPPLPTTGTRCHPCSLHPHTNHMGLRAPSPPPPGLPNPQEPQPLRVCGIRGNGQAGQGALILGKKWDVLWRHLIALGTFQAQASLLTVLGGMAQPHFQMSHPGPRGRMPCPRSLADPLGHRQGHGHSSTGQSPEEPRGGGGEQSAGAQANACPHAPHSYGDPKQWVAFLGTPFLSGADGQLERVARIYKHPFYNLYTLDYDVALLELAGPVHRSRLVRPICLPEPTPRPPDGARCVITGWGSVREGGRRVL